MPSFEENVGGIDRSSDYQSQQELDQIGSAVADFPKEKPYSVAIKEVPVTEERKPYVPGRDDRLVDAGTARATVAASKESPNGTLERNWAQEHQHQTVSPSLLKLKGDSRR